MPIWSLFASLGGILRLIKVYTFSFFLLFYQAESILIHDLMSLPITWPLLWNTNATDRKLNGQESVIRVSEYLSLSMNHWKQCAVHSSIWQRKGMEKKLKISLVAEGGTCKGWESWCYYNWTGGPETRATWASALCPSGGLKGDSGSSSMFPMCPWVVWPQFPCSFFFVSQWMWLKGLYNLWTHMEPMYIHGDPPHHMTQPGLFPSQIVIHLHFLLGPSSK